MTLFEIDESNYTVKLNRVWIRLIPEFDDIMKRDKGSTGDKGGHRKMWASKRFAYIYFYLDFKSPIYTWDDDKRSAEAMRYTGLTQKDLDAEYMDTAISTYKKLQEEASRSLKTLRRVTKGLAAMDDYFENINFTLKDRQGKVLHTTKDYMANIANLNKMYDELNKFEKRVMAELTEKGGIRGAAEKGDREEKKLSTGEVEWSEVGGEEESKSPNFLDMTTGELWNDEKH